MAALPGLREALGLADGASTTETDRIEQQARALVTAMEDLGWPLDASEAMVDYLRPLVEARRQLGALERRSRVGSIRAR